MSGPASTRPDLARQRIARFERQFGPAHMHLARHAAFPLALTPDLLYRLAANFQRDVKGMSLSIPWVAVADLLLSRLCDEVGHELYEMKEPVRAALLNDLKADAGRFGEQRLNDLAAFLNEYVQRQLESPEPDIKEFAQAQHWAALAYIAPDEAARELTQALADIAPRHQAEVLRLAAQAATGPDAAQEMAQALANIAPQDQAALLRLASLVEAFAEPMERAAESVALRAYARGVAGMARGDVGQTQTQLDVVTAGSANQIAGVPLPAAHPIGADAQTDRAQSGEPFEADIDAAEQVSETATSTPLDEPPLVREFILAAPGETLGNLLARLPSDRDERAQTYVVQRDGEGRYVIVRWVEIERIVAGMRATSA